MEEFPDRLRETRIRCGYTQSELEKAAGLAPTHVSQFECGQRLPSLENFREIVCVLGHCEYLLSL